MMFLIGMAATFIGLLIPFISVPDEGVMNVFQGASFFNEPGIAYISTFMVIVWLAALAGVVLYFVTDFMVADFIAWLVGAAFGIAHTVSMCLYSVENEYSLFGWIFIGSIIAFVGMTLALVGLILQAIHIQHPLAPKAE
ncbi:MAG: hypothetical protein IJS09_01205 [Treponema sp.]|nr:hypothetical protein [Treponema sp.]